MKDTNIVRIKAYVGKYDNAPYVVNELPVSGEPNRYFADKSVRDLITKNQYDELVKLLNYYNYHTSYYCQDRIETPWFFHSYHSWDDYSPDDCYYMIFDLEVETRVTVHESKTDEVQDYIKVTAADMKRFLWKLKDKP